ncbi:MAG: hypothetical protein H6925_04045 [Holosporaceae bacterium]|nr:MAG: hypothetical protein H6925_04045 [Holosporaceae bacterium]
MNPVFEKEGFSDADIQTAGLVSTRDDGSTYDKFRGRIMFPITDRRGRVVAFGGRLLDPGEPKYLNSPETPSFTKGTFFITGQKHKHPLKRLAPIGG